MNANAVGGGGGVTNSMACKVGVWTSATAAEPSDCAERGCARSVGVVVGGTIRIFFALVLRAGVAIMPSAHRFERGIRRPTYTPTSDIGSQYQQSG